MKKPKKRKAKKGHLAVGPDRPLGRLTHKPDINITVINIVGDVTVVQGRGGAPMDPEKIKFIEKCIAVACGVAFVAALLVLAVVIPNPTPTQKETFRIVMAIAAAGFVAVTPGFLELNIANWIRTGGALAVFVIVYFYSPASLVAP